MLTQPSSAVYLPAKGTLFITGGSFGIGEDAMRYLASRYTSVYNYDVHEGHDVRDYGGLFRALDHTLSPLGQNDLLLSAGVFRPIDFLDQSPADIDFVVDTNLKGVLYAAHAFLSWHARRGHIVTPNIVIISSISAFFPGGSTNVVYDSTKAALSFLVKNLANFNCVANAIQPGTVRGTHIGEWTPEFSSDPVSKALVDQGQAKDVEALGLEVTKADVTETIEMLLFHNKRGAINGTTITVDAGLTVKQQRF